MKNLKALIIAGTIIAVAAIATMIYFVAFRDNSDSTTNTNWTVNDPSKHVEEPPEETPKEQLDQNGNPKSPYGTSTYYSKGGFSLDYPTDLFIQYKKERTFPGPLGSTMTTTLDEFKHEIPVQYCALSGNCVPTTIDMAFGAFKINDTFDPKDFPDLNLKKKSFVDIQAWEGQQGAEGEGIVYVFIPSADGNQYTVIYRTYIDENIVLSYKKAKDFIPIKQQEEIFRKIVTSLD